MRLSLLLDLYELTMAAGYLRHGMHEKPAVFDLYFRANPFNGDYAIFAGLEPALDHLEGLRFDRLQMSATTGMNIATIGVLLRKALEAETGIRSRSCALSSDFGRPRSGSVSMVVAPV